MRPIAIILFFTLIFLCILSYSWVVISATFYVSSVTASSLNSAGVQFLKIWYSIPVIFSAKKGIDQLIKFKLSGKR